MAQGDAALRTILCIGESSSVTPILMKYAFFIPDIKHISISCSALCLDRYTITFGRSRCSVRKYGELRMSVRMIQGLYPVETAHVSVGTATAACRLRFDSQLWHARLGHANIDSIRNHLLSIVVQDPDGKSDNSGKSGCRSCAGGRQSRCVRHSNPVRASKVGEAVQSDV